MANRDPFDDYDDEDGGYLTFDARDDYEESGRGPIILAAIVLLLAVLGAIVWVYIVGNKSNDDNPPAVEAQTEPFKELAVTNETGATNQVGNEVYGAAEGAIPPPLSVEAMNNEVAPIVPTEAVAPPPTKATTPAVTNVTRPVTKTVAPAPTPAPKATTMASNTTPRPTTTPKATTPPPAPKTTTAATPAATRPAASSGGFSAQLGSFTSRAAAETALNSYRATGLSGPVSVVAADLGAKGTWYRIKATGFESRDQVVGFCEKARSAGANCIPSN